MDFKGTLAKSSLQMKLQHFSSKCQPAAKLPGICWEKFADLRFEELERDMTWKGFLNNPSLSLCPL